MLYIYLGDDDYSQEQAVRRLQEALGPLDMATLNTERLEPQGLSPNDLIGHCAAAPFLALGRLIVVRGLLASFDQEGGGRRKAPPDAQRWQALADFAPTMPPSTTLVLRDGAVKAANPVLRMLSPAATEVKTFAPLKGPDLVRWVQERVRGGGGRIAGGAGQKLADTVGGNLWVMSGEVEKLLLYCDGRQIGLEDVEKLSGFVKEEQMWTLADAFVERRYPQARRLLARVLEGGGSASQVLNFVGTQVRRAIVAKEAQSLSRDAKVVRMAVEASLPANQRWLADRVLRQAQGYSMEELVALHGKVMGADMAIKTGRLTEEAALELLLAEALSRAARAGGR